MPKQSYPASWSLTPVETAYLDALRPGKIVGVADLAPLHPRVLTDPAGRVRRTIGQLRRKLDPLDVEIATKWNEGWVLQRAARARLTSLVRAG